MNDELVKFVRCEVTNLSELPEWKQQAFRHMENMDRISRRYEIVVIRNRNRDRDRKLNDQTYGS
jgi:hypothetical protein